MRKILALTLVFVMVFATALTVSAANGNTENETVEAKFFSKAPTFDGVITAAEWGDPTVKVTNTYKTAFQVDNGSGPLTMDIYLRWDANFFYVGVTSPDTDGQSLPAGADGSWNGDVVQFRVDPKGPNSTGNKDVPFDDAAVRNMALGLLTSTGAEETWNYHGAADFAGKAMEGHKFKFGNAGGVFTWEIAVPHSYLGTEGKEGALVGMSLVRLNAPKDGTYNGWLTWGDGVCGPQDATERCGSNGVKFVKTEAVKPVEVKTSTGSTATATATSDVEYAMFAVLAVIALAGAFWVTKKSR